MDGGNRPIRWIGDQDREAIGCANGQRYPRTIRNECVAFAQASGLLRHDNLIRVGLPEGGKAGVGRPIGAESCPEAVFQPGQFVKRLSPVHSLAVDTKQS